jgi:stage V sporulation protein D (sporulation-specific penicillin-binding protein)
MRTHLVARVRVLYAFFIIASIFLIARLYLVQIVHGDEYRQDALGQYREQSPEAADRGTIYFTTKDGALVSAAAMQSGWRIAIKPQDIENIDETFTALNKLTPVDKERFYASAKKTSDPYEEVAFRVSDTAAKAIRALDIPGVLLVQDKWRSYPGDELAAQAVGFVGYKGNTKVGVYGLEREWQATLSHESDGLYVNPFAENFQ